MASLSNAVTDSDAPTSRFSAGSRTSYLIDFMNFTDADVEVLRAAAPVVKALLPALIDDIYVKLFNHAETRRVFVDRYGQVDPRTGEKTLALGSEYMKERKDFLTRFFKIILEGDYKSGKVFRYMEKVGFIHAAQLSSRNAKPLFVPVRDSLLLLGHIEGELARTVINAPEELVAEQSKVSLLAAFNKVLWIQGELMSHAQTSDKQRPTSLFATNQDLQLLATGLMALLVIYSASVTQVLRGINSMLNTSLPLNNTVGMKQAW